uniref:RecA family profile 1 domain-containing protein n=1 Tax=Parascaris univalens TaxID=6257 RepID=A0A915BIN7_PARUN
MYFSFLLVDLGPRATTNESLPRGALKTNTLNNQLSPKASNIYLRIGYRKDNEFISIVEAPLRPTTRMGGYYLDNAITYTHLNNLLSDNDVITFRVSLQVEREYFNIGKLGDIKSLAIIEERNVRTLESVLKGDSSANDSTDYYVHKAPLAYTSITLRSIFDKKVSLPTDQILIESGEDRIIFPFLSESDMKFLLTYLYTERISLPEYNRFARVGRVISFLFDRDRLINIFTQWQRLIIESILEADDNQKVVIAMRSLIAIYSAPYGALPIAKRVAISTLADQIARQGDELTDKIKEDEEFKKYSIERILESALKLKRLITAVKKTSYD